MKLEIVQNTKQLEDAYFVRRIVFVEEQNVPIEEELDQFDAEATHCVLYNEAKQPIGAGRVRFLNNYAKIERISVLKEARKEGAGKLIMEAIEAFSSQKGIQDFKLNAQEHAIAFYKKLGYTIASEQFLDAGIPHYTMVKRLQDIPFYPNKKAFSLD